MTQHMSAGLCHAELSYNERHQIPWQQLSGTRCNTFDQQHVMVTAATRHHAVILAWSRAKVRGWGESSPGGVRTIMMRSCAITRKDTTAESNLSSCSTLCTRAPAQRLAEACWVSNIQRTHANPGILVLYVLDLTSQGCCAWAEGGRRTTTMVHACLNHTTAEALLPIKACTEGQPISQERSEERSAGVCRAKHTCKAKQGHPLQV